MYGHGTASLVVGKLSCAETGRIPSPPPRSRSTGRCVVPSTPPATWPGRTTAARSPASSTRARHRRLALHRRPAERRAQRAVAVSFWLLAPYIVIEAVRDLLGGHHAGTTVLGIVLTALSVIVMPVLGVAKHRLGARLDSEATAAEGTQNLICA